MQAAIGNLFVGAFARLLPYVNAIVMVIKYLARFIASFFGIKMKDYNSGLASYANDLDEYSDSLDGVGSSADGAANSIKALKRQVLGFDQINNLTTPTPSSSSGGGGGGAALGGIDDKLLAALEEYENGMKLVEMEANKIRDRIMEWLGFTKEINEETHEISFTYDTTGKKISDIAKEIATNLGNMLNYYTNKIDWGKLGETLAEGLNTAFGFIDSFVQTYDWRNLGNKIAEFLNKAIKNTDFATIGRVLTDKLRIAILGLTGFLEKFDFEEFAHKIADLINGMIENVPVDELIKGINALADGIFTVLNTLIQEINWGELVDKIVEILNGLDWKAKLLVLAPIIGKAFSGLFGSNLISGGIKSGLLSALGGSGGAAGGAAAGSIGALIGIALAEGTVGGVNLGYQTTKFAKKYDETGSFTKAMEPDGVVDAFSKIGAEGTLSTVGPYFNIFKALAPTIDGITEDFHDWDNLFNGITDEMIEGAKKAEDAVYPVLDKIHGLQISLAPINLGIEVNEDAVNTVMTRIDELTGDIKTKMETEKQTMIDNINSLVESGLMTQEEADASIKRIEETYGAYEKTTTEAQNSIKEILETAAKEHRSLTEEELAVVDKNYKLITESTVGNLTQSKEGQKYILEQLQAQNADITMATASQMIQSAILARDEQIKAAGDTYNGTIEKYKRMMELGYISADTYNAIIEDAKKTRDETVQAAEDQYDKTYDALKTNHGDIAKYIDKDTGGVSKKWKKKYEGMTDEAKKNYGKVEQDTKTSMNNVQTTINNTPLTIKMKLDTSGARDAYNSFVDDMNSSKSGSDLAIKCPAKISAFANGGIPTTGQLFFAREAGPELVGRIGRHTAVMNNNQIVDSVKTGVYEAVSAAMGSGNIGGIEVVAHTDEGVIIDRINKITRQTGECPINI